MRFSIFMNLKYPNISPNSIEYSTFIIQFLEDEIRNRQLFPANFPKWQCEWRKERSVDSSWSTFICGNMERGEVRSGGSLDNAIVGRLNEGWWWRFACVQRRRRKKKKKRSRAEDGKRGMSEDTRGVFRQPASFVHQAKGVSRQPEGVTPAYSYAGNGGRRKLESGGTRNTPTVLLRCCAPSGR